MWRRGCWPIDRALFMTSAILITAHFRETTASRAGELAGYQMAVASFRTGDTEIFIVDPATGDARNLTRSPNSSERYPSFSPDGSKVAFNSNRDGTHNLYLIDADGSNLRQLTHERRGVEAGMQSWTADGKWIYFGLFGKGDPRMCRIFPDGSHFEEVGKGIDPAVSPDGKTVAFARALPDGHHLFSMDADGSNVRQLTAKGNAFAGVHCTWTLDGKTIIYADQVNDALEIFSIEADGNNARQLTRLGKAATTPAVSPDMRWISFRLCDEIYWRDGKSSERAYRERRADKRPVWVMGIDGSSPHVMESLHYQTTIDGSRAPWQPRPSPRPNSGASSTATHHSKLATTSGSQPAERAENKDTAASPPNPLWQALTRALPEKHRQIDAYAVNSALTKVLLYSHGAILKFSLSSKKLEVIWIKKVLGTINRITFDEQDDSGTWRLWFNGRQEASIDDSVTGAVISNEGKRTSPDPPERP